MTIEDSIRTIIGPTVEALGFELVRVTFGGEHRPKLQVMAERPDGTMSIEDCADLSHEISALLDVEDPVPGEYVLEVSSPGIDRPLTRRKDFVRWAGFEARIELANAVGGQRRFKGILLGLEADNVRLRVDGEDVDLPYAGVIKAKLVLTDALLEAARGPERMDDLPGQQTP